MANEKMSDTCFSTEYHFFRLCVEAIDLFTLFCYKHIVSILSFLFQDFLKNLKKLLTHWNNLIFLMLCIVEGQKYAIGGEPKDTKGFLVVLPGEIIEIPRDSDKSWLNYQQFSNLIGNVTDMVIAEESCQPMIDAIW